MTHLIVGIDLGKTGALCLFDLDTTKIIAIKDFPLSDNGSSKLIIDPASLYGLLYRFQQAGAEYILIEHVHAMPLGSLASFSMGHCDGLIKGIAAALKMPLYVVAPLKWKNHYKLTNKDKYASLTLARLRWGEDYFKLKKHHNRAEAALIAALPAEIYLD